MVLFEKILVATSNVGIGTSSPLSTLHVNGSMMASYVTTSTSASRAYPPVKTFTNNVQTVSGQAYGNGTYTVSSIHTSFAGSNLFNAFDSSSTTAWTSTNTYSAQTWQGTPVTVLLNNMYQSIAAQDFQLQLPVSVIATQFSFQGINGAQAPVDHMLIGSPDGVTWFTLFSQTGISSYTVSGTFNVTGNTRACRYYKYLVTKAWNTAAGYLQIADFTLTGYEVAQTMNTGIVMTSAGNVGVNTSTPQYRMHVEGAIYASGDIIALSDRRYKDNLAPIQSALDRVEKLTGYTYTRTDGDESLRHAGLMAQDVLNVLPEVVSYDAENDRYAIKYGNMAALFIEAIKELRTECRRLQDRVDELESSKT